MGVNDVEEYPSAQTILIAVFPGTAVIGILNDPETTRGPTVVVASTKTSSPKSVKIPFWLKSTHIPIPFA